MKVYNVAFEIEGPYAMFMRPDTGAAPISYPVPTFSAAKGLFEAVARYETAYIRPTKLEVCKPIKFHRYVTNYNGPLRKSSQISKDTAHQIMATILTDVCYRIYGVVEEVKRPENGLNHIHALQEIFLRRLNSGKHYSKPCLGWKEFVPSYIGPFRTETNVEDTFNQIIPSMLFSVFNPPVNGKYAPVYRQNVEIKNGELIYA